MKYIIYLRVSTDHQVRSGLGLEAQRDLCLKQVQKDSTVLEFADEGIKGSWKMERRPGLLAAIAALSKDDIMLIAKRDRLGRDPIVNAMIERAIERKKAKLVSASGDTSDDNDPTSILMRRMVDAFAEYERLIIGARTKAALQVKKNKNERVGHIPYGYRLSEDKIHLESDPYEQEVLNQIICFRNKEGMALRKIASELNQKSLFNRGGNSWNHLSVRRVMK